MKRAFTLVEMLIVVALIATLMTIVLRLSSVGADESKRNTTIVRLAKLENCLSGYFAAYGSYPPVRLHNSRSIYEGVNEYGVQNLDNSRNKELSESELWNWDVKQFQKDVKTEVDAKTDPSTQDVEKRAWAQVKAACESQPVSLEAPDPDIDNLEDILKSLQNAVRDGEYAKSSDLDYSKWSDGFQSVYNNMGGLDDATDWRKVQIFKFGLMSFLLPRFQAMMGWRESMMFDGDGSCLYAQWNANNGNAPHDPLEGSKSTWKEINREVSTAMGYDKSSNEDSLRESSAYLEALPTEAVTARWMPNLEGICTCDYPTRTFFGIAINNTDNTDGMFASSRDDMMPLTVYKSKSGSYYHLNTIAVLDGWGTTFFYYSPTPHQSYQLWSAGKNRRTFPPWISRQNLDSKAREHVVAWTEDDIGGLSN